MPHLPSSIVRCVALAVALLTSSLIAGPAAAEATLVVEAATGKVLHAEHATYPWYPASTTKLMTMYLTLKAVKDKRLDMDSLLTVSANAVAQAPSKIGFKAGTQLTVDNALKMLMVKSANDVAVVLAEGLSGSIEKFADEMNAASKRLGMTQSSWVNPNGLPADEQITSARDMAILARALILEFPEYEMYWRIPAIRYGKRTMPNHNGLMTYYPGTDGMKTGFICASGFNVVATASRNGRRLIVIVFGSPSGGARTVKAAQLFEKGFNGSGLSWLMPSLGTVDALQPIAAAPPNLRDEMCGPGRKRPASEEAESEEIATNGSSDTDNSSAYAVSARTLRDRLGKHMTMLGGTPPPPMPPVVVYLGAPKKQGETLVAARPGKRKGTAVVDVPAKPRAAAASMVPGFTPASAESKPATVTPAAETPDTPAPRKKRKHAADKK